MQNYSYIAEKYYDDLYERSESVSQKECPECKGRGKVLFSCCGDDISDNDIDICPTCHEHCGDDWEKCDYCNGEGVVS